MATEPRVSVRVDEDLKGDVKKVVDMTGITETTLVEATLRALVDYFKKHGNITLPLIVQPKNAVSEESPRYGRKSKKLKKAA